MPHPLRVRGIDLSALAPDPPPALQYDPFAEPWQPTQQPGWLEDVEIDQPAAGVLTVTHTCPGDLWERPIQITFTVVADANVANRIPSVRFLNAKGNDIAHVARGGNLVANGTSFQNFGVGQNIALQTNDGWTVGPLPEVIMMPGYSIILRIQGGQATDQMSNIRLRFQRWRNRPRRRQHPAPLILP